MHYEVYVDVLLPDKFYDGWNPASIDSGDSEMSDYMGQTLSCSRGGGIGGSFDDGHLFAEFLAQEHVGVSVRRSRYDLLCVSGPLFFDFLQKPLWF